MMTEYLQGGNMYVAVCRLYFEEGEFQFEARDLKSLRTSLQSRFPIQVRVDNSSKSEAPNLVVCSLDHSQEKLGQLLDKVYAHCEDFGIGRLDREDAFLDHIDNLLCDD